MKLKVISIYIIMCLLVNFVASGLGALIIYGLTFDIRVFMLIPIISFSMLIVNDFIIKYYTGDMEKIMVGIRDILLEDLKKEK